MGGQVRTPKLSLEGGGQLRTPKLSLADAGEGGAPPLVTLSLLLRFFFWCGFPQVPQSPGSHYHCTCSKASLLSCFQAITLVADPHVLGRLLCKAPGGWISYISVFSYGYSPKEFSRSGQNNTHKEFPKNFLFIKSYRAGFQSPSLPLRAGQESRSDHRLQILSSY